MERTKTFKKPLYVLTLLFFILLTLASAALYIMVFVKKVAEWDKISGFVTKNKDYLINIATCLGVAALTMFVFNIFDLLRLLAHNKSSDVIRRKRNGIIAIGIIFIIIFGLMTAYLFVIIYLNQNSTVSKIINKLKIPYKEAQKNYWLFAASAFAIGTGLILFRTIMCPILLSKKKLNSKGKESSESNNDSKQKELKDTSTVEIVKTLNPNIETSTSSEIDFGKFNLTIIQDNDTKISNSNTPVTSEKLQELQNLFNEVTTFAEKIDSRKYSPLIKYVNDALENFTVKVNENLTHESVLSKINNLTINFKRARLLLLLLDCKEYALEISSKTQLKLIGNALLNYVNKKINDFNNLNSLRQTKSLINEVLEQYLITKLNQDILEVNIEIRKYPNEETLNKKALDIIATAKSAISSKNVDAIKKTIVNLEKLKNDFNKLPMNNLSM